MDTSHSVYPCVSWWLWGLLSSLSRCEQCWQETKAFVYWERRGFVPPEEKGIKFCSWFWTWPPVSSPVLLRQIFTATWNSSALEVTLTQGHPANEGTSFLIVRKSLAAASEPCIAAESRSGAALTSHVHADFSRQSPIQNMASVCYT